MPATAVHRCIQVLFVLLVGLQVLDMDSTFQALGQGRSEVNGLILFLARACGMHVAVAIFKVTSIAITIYYYKYSLNCISKRYVLAPLFALVASYTVVVLNNYSS